MVVEIFALIVVLFAWAMLLASIVTVWMCMSTCDRKPQTANPPRPGRDDNFK